MAIYSFNVSNLTRGTYSKSTRSTTGKKKSANSCATLAYITGKEIYCERTNETFHYGGIERVMYSETFLPDGAPEEWKDASVLWNVIENSEKNANARLGKKFIVALPNELEEKDQKIVAQELASEITAMGYPCTVALHHVIEQGKPQNDHLHLLASSRAWDSAKGTWKCKRKQIYRIDEETGERCPVWETVRDENNAIIKDENGDPIYKLDENGEKIQKVDSHNRKQWQRDTVTWNQIDRDETLVALREKWAEICNKHLDKDHQISSKSYAEQGIDKLPTIHEGFEARIWEAKGNTSEKCERNREIKEINEELERLDAEMAQKIAENKQLEAEIEQLTWIEKMRATVESLGARLEKAWATIQARFTSPVTIEDCLEDPEKILEFKSNNELINKIITSHAFDMDPDNLRAVTATVEFLDKHNIDNLEKFKNVYEGLTQDINATLKDYETLSKKLSIANEGLTARKTVAENKNVYESYREVAEKNNPVDKGVANDYYTRHQAEIDGYKKATAFLRDTYKQKIPTTKEIKTEIDTLKSQMEQTANDFREMRVLGFDMQEIYSGLVATLDIPGYEWKPTRTLRYDIADAVPDELKVYRGHTDTIRPIRNTERERKKYLQEHDRIIIHSPPEISH